MYFRSDELRKNLLILWAVYAGSSVAVDSSLSSRSQSNFRSNSTTIDTITLPSLASAFTFTTKNYTFTISTAADGKANPTTISEPGGVEAIFVSSYLVIVSPSSLSSTINPSTCYLDTVSPVSPPKFGSIFSFSNSSTAVPSDRESGQISQTSQSSNVILSGISTYTSGLNNISTTSGQNTAISSTQVRSSPVTSFKVQE